MLSRRTVMSSAVAAAVAPAHARAQGAGGESPTILRVQRRSLEVNGKPASVLGIGQPNGTPGLVTSVGRNFRARVENHLDVPTLIHWHGLAPPWQQDGVPNISAPPIPPGGSADYDFPLHFGGTFWMHSHEGLQEQLLLSAPLIIHDARDRPGQQEVVMMLADFSFTPPEQIFEGLRKAGGMPGMAASASTQPSAMGGMTMPKGTAMGGMAMAPKPQAQGTGMGGMAMGGMAMGGKPAAPDLNDVKYDAFLANDRTLADPEVIRVEAGGTLLLRVINSAAMSAFHLDLGALNGELIAVDGALVQPVTAKRFPIAVAQRLDIRIKVPRTPASHPVLAILEGERNQTGLILQAGRAPVRKVTALAPAASPALTLDLERRLRAMEPLAPRKADRVHQVNLTGTMAGYVWSLNGVVWNKDTPPLPVTAGQRVELVYDNQTPMPHPMHLHGHTFQVVEIDGKRFLRRAA